MLKRIFGSLLAVLLLGFPVASLAFMSSTNFQIISDTIGVGGGLSTSTSYGLQDTLGTISIGIVSSTSYRIIGGFQTSESNGITLQVNNTSLNLGTLSSSMVSSANTTATVTTDAPTGYTLSVGAVTGTSVTPVADGSITAGSEEYGLTTTGAESLVSTDVAVTNGLNLASSAAAITGSATMIVFKASISSASAQATYSQNITLTAASNP